MQKRRSIALIEFIRKYFSHFFALVNNEVTSDHQRPDYLAKCHIFRKCAIISEPVIGRALRKQALDSSLTALSLEWRQNCSNFNMLGYRGQERSK